MTGQGQPPILEVRDLRKEFRSRPSKGTWRRNSGAATDSTVAVRSVSLDVYEGETLGVVGESGCGKSTLALCILQLTRPTAGTVHFGGVELTGASQRRLRAVRRELQVVFQDPYSSLNWRRTVGDLLLEPLRIHRIDTEDGRRRRVNSLLEMVGLPWDAIDRYPTDFSGGQRQRIVIARALTLEPKLLICDEPVSALDVSVQAQILNVLRSVQRALSLTLIFISHDLAVVRPMSDRIAVMRGGEIVEIGDAEQVYVAPRHAYTQALLNAMPSLDPEAARKQLRLRSETFPPAGSGPTL